MSSSTTSAATSTSQEESFPPPSVPIPAADPASTSSSLGGGMTQAFCFSSGNPRIKETRSVMHLFPDNAVSSSSPDLPVGRKPLVCVFGVPDHMTYANFCQFCASFIHHILEMRIVRIDGMEDRYSILIRMDGQDTTDNFYRYFNGRHFNSLEVEVCRIRYTVDIQYTGYKGSIEHPQTSPVATSEQSSCLVCLERLDQDTSGILTTICNHSFHISCISNWNDSSCPVCRYYQQQPEKSTCLVCQTSENLWMCVICGFIGCGRYKGGHAMGHWKETQHRYSLGLETQRVWDYAGNSYVHQLIQSKTAGKLVELNSHRMHSRDGCGSCMCADSGLNEALLNSKVEVVIVKEYADLPATQLENQKLVCRYCRQQPEKSTCLVCQTSENLWMCVICGFVGCGRYKGGHAMGHWKETQHHYSLGLETQRVWDYAGESYVHQLIQSKTDGKLVELNSRCMHSRDGCGSCMCADSGLNEALLNSKVEVIVKEYESLLATQLENQKLVCPYCQQQPEKSTCLVCQTSENLWMCVICGFVGCGRYKGGHAMGHWKETQHRYSLGLETQRVWDYADKSYVHQLIQSKTDGKLVELNSHCMHSRDGCGSCMCADSGLNEALLNSKEYDDLLATQLENQKLYYETLLQEFEEKTEREILEAVEMALATNSKVQKKQAKLDECVREKKFLDELNENLLANQEIWKAKLLEADERERNALRAKDDKIQQLEEELKDLMACLEEGNSN